MYAGCARGKALAVKKGTGRVELVRRRRGEKCCGFELQRLAVQSNGDMEVGHVGSMDGAYGADLGAGIGALKEDPMGAEELHRASAESWGILCQGDLRTDASTCTLSKVER